MEKKEDLRIVKTKKALLDAFMILMEEKRFEDITVNELCIRANIRRATFYKHFDDKFAFLTFMIKSLRNSFDNEVWKRGTPDATNTYFVEYARALICFVNEHETAIKRILESEMRDTLINLIVEQQYHDTKNNLDKSVSEGMVLPVSSETVAVMLTGGIEHIIIRWLAQGKKKPEEELTREITLLIDCILGSRTPLVKNK